MTFTELPAPFDVRNGEQMWVGRPTSVSENSGVVSPGDAPASPTFWAVTLQCEPFFTDWTRFDTIHVFHERIIPGGLYSLQTINDNCGGIPEAVVSAPLEVATARWGDIVESCVTTPCTGPDGSVDIVTDIVALIDKFSNRPGAPIKSRADLEPAVPDQLINISDITRALDGFKDLPYPFTPGPSPCP